MSPCTNTPIIVKFLISFTVGGFLSIIVWQLVCTLIPTHSPFQLSIMAGPNTILCLYLTFTPSSLYLYIHAPALPYGFLLFVAIYCMLHNLPLLGLNQIMDAPLFGIKGADCSPGILVYAYMWVCMYTGL